MSKKASYEELEQKVKALEKETDERKQVEKALRESEEKYRSLFEQSKDAIVITSKNGKFIDANHSALELLGYDREEIERMNFQELYVDPDDGYGFVKEMKKKGSVKDFRTRLHRKDGKETDCLMGVIFRRAHGGKVSVYQGIIRDITELEESLSLLRTTLDATADGILVVGKEGKITTLNKRFVKMWGIPEAIIASREDEKALGFVLDQLIDPGAFLNKVKELYSRPAEKSFDTLKFKDGRIFERYSRPQMLERKIVGRVWSFRDVTGRCQTEKELRESEERHRTILENIEDGYYEVDIAGNFTFFNESMCKMIGYSGDEMMGMNNRRFMDEENAREVFQTFNAIYESGKPTKAFDWKLIRKDGSDLFVETSVSLVRDSEGQPVGFRGIARDVSQRREMEQALRESEERYRTILENIVDGYFEVDLAGNLTFFNGALHEISGNTREEIMGLNNREYMDEENAGKVFQVFNQVYHTGKPVKGFEYEIILRADGSKKDVETSVSLMRNAEGEPTGFRGVLRDISENKRLEAQVREAEKMEAIATLAGGIAHQFNNALTPIIGHVSLLEMEHRENEKTMASLKEMKTSGHRMARLTSQLLAYARGGKYNPQIMSLTAFVTDTLPLIEHTLGSDIRIETDLPLDVMNVDVDNTQLQMVLSAIVTNSNEAIEGPGRIRISTRNIDVDRVFAKDHPGLKLGSFVCLSIEDDGKGMDEETKKKIFDPFFTTHFIGRGLGMASVYGIVKNHNGSITVDSEPGQGTLVRIYLPAIESKEGIKKNVLDEVKTQLPKGEGTILVIEGEEDVMMIIRQTLTRLGYGVLEAKTGKKAIDIAETFDGQIDLALLDIKLPDMWGDKVYPLIMKAKPNLKVIVCTGYAIEGPAQDILDAGAEGFIQKPFSISTFGEKIRQVLEAP